MRYSNVVTATAVTGEMMRSLLKEWDGDWRDSDSNSSSWFGGEWILQPADHEPASITVSLFFNLDTDYSESEQEQLQRLLGAKPRVMISIETSDKKGSVKLTEDFVRDALERFGGFYDNGDGLPDAP